MKIALSQEIYSRLIKHLFSGKTEQVAFLLGMPTDTSPRIRLEQLLCIPPEGFTIQSEYHVSLTDETRAHVIKWAWDHQACLVEAHSHRGYATAAFSPSDIAGFREFVPHVWWRLQGRPYAAFVFTQNEFDALAWTKSPHVAQQVTTLEVDGRQDRLPTAESLHSYMRRAHDAGKRTL
ncbi:hypothetical protein [Nitrospira moscoviensis]|uniref:JAB domain-containing protein n=1 Tax=Nitrospira moscoviensis TaxID=42253 RepID=A0A0K2GEQ1_NITMO|nr:hypothetical protein [Nitrospira moscoviensis]ALA59344.1 hypothetical protein NITMOv2_2939 [Nitrospira moscoviensis]